MTAPTIAATIRDQDVDRFEAFVGRAQPPPSTDSAPSPFAGLDAQKDPPGLGRAILTASAISIPFVLVAITLGLLASGTSFISALGIGVFAALWGGGGFGAMIGGVVHNHRLEESATRTVVVGSAEDHSPALLPPWPSDTALPGAR